MMETQEMAHKRILALNGFKSAVQTKHDWNQAAELFIVKFDAFHSGQRVAVELQEDMDGDVVLWSKGYFQEDVSFKSVNENYKPEPMAREDYVRLATPVLLRAAFKNLELYKFVCEEETVFIFFHATRGGFLVDVKVEVKERLGTTVFLSQPKKDDWKLFI